MVIDVNSLLIDLKLGLDNYDRERAEGLCNDLIHRIRSSGERCPHKDAYKILGLLRRKRLFVLMDRLGSALIEAGETSMNVRCEHAQALIDQKFLSRAESALKKILSDRESGIDIENGGLVPHKAIGLLGRVYKQMYVTPGDARAETSNLLKAVEAYQRAFDECEGEFWYAINLVALAARAARDGVSIPGSPDPGVLARRILDQITRRDSANISLWDMATCAEASIAISDLDGAREWLRDYLRSDDADAFEVSSTYRQLIEVWQLVDDSEPGQSLLPLLRHGIASRRFGVLALGGAELRAGLADATQVTFQRTYGPDYGKALSWYRAMLDAARGVAQVASRKNPGIGVGSGFLVMGADFLSPLGAQALRADELVLLTNQHVISKTNPKALLPGDAVANFEALEDRALSLRLGEVLWESVDLDATLVRLESPISPKPALEYIHELRRDARPPILGEGAHQRVFVIGHPRGGPLTIALFDSLQVGWKEPFLHYRTPTAEGSSGSPVFDESWGVLAVHHAAVNSFGNAGVVEANEGIWIHAIRSRARQSP